MYTPCKLVRVACISFLQSTDIPDTDFVLEPHLEEINRLFNGNTVEEIVENLKTDGSEWATKQLNTLSKMVQKIISIQNE